MRQVKWIFIFIVTVLFILFFTMFTCYANSAEPPSLIVILHNAPKNTVVSIVTNDLSYEHQKRSVAWEDYYIFYYGRNVHSKIILQVLNGDNNYEILVNMNDLKGYQRTLTLDYPNRVYVPGKMLTRSIFLVFIRVIFTLFIEGAIFYTFNFNKKASWIIFLIINLITQGILNIWLNGFAPFTSYVIIELIIMEMFILFIETITLLLFLREHKISKRILFSFCANLSSLFIGGYLITALPL